MTNRAYRVAQIIEELFSYICTIKQKQLNHFAVKTCISFKVNFTTKCTETIIKRLFGLKDICHIYTIAFELKDIYTIISGLNGLV